MDSKTFIKNILAPAGITINGQHPWDLQVKNPDVYRTVLIKGSLGLGESYMQGWWECQALDQFFYRLFLANVQEKVTFDLPLILQYLKAALLNLQSSQRAFEVGKKHYDLGNDFFEKMLGPSMAYSCGYWKGAQDLDTAQFAKFDLICRKLNLQPGQKILDIGCGWGSFAKYAAENYGVSVVGITISKEQLAYAKNLCKGLPVEFRLQDYRQLNEQFDHIVSVGMFEHVGYKNYKTYLQVARRCLRGNGLFLLHTIGSATTVRAGDPWLTKYIFPNGSLPSLKQIASAAEKIFVIEDVHNFGADYDKTLMAWHQNFETAWLARHSLGVSEPKSYQQYSQTFYRMWRYYLLSCAGAFRARNIQLWQMVLSPHGVEGGYKSAR